MMHVLNIFFFAPSSSQKYLVLEMDIHPRRLVKIGAERVSHVGDTEFPGHYPSEDHSWDLDKFREVRIYWNEHPESR